MHRGGDVKPDEQQVITVEGQKLGWLTNPIAAVGTKYTAKRVAAMAKCSRKARAVRPGHKWRAFVARAEMRFKRRREGVERNQRHQMRARRRVLKRGPQQFAQTS